MNPYAGETPTTSASFLKEVGVEDACDVAASLEVSDRPLLVHGFRIRAL